MYHTTVFRVIYQCMKLHLKFNFVCEFIKVCGLCIDRRERSISIFWIHFIASVFSSLSLIFNM